MRKWCVLGGVVLLGAVIAAVPLRAQDDSKAKVEIKEQRSQAEREIKELEAQRERLDSRIRELRKKAGLSEERRIIVRSGDDKEIKGLTDEQRVEIKRALGESHRAVEEALKNMPDVHRIIEKSMPDVGKIIEKSMRLYVGPDGEVHRFEGPMSKEEREKFGQKMQGLREKLRTRTEVLPRVRAFGGFERGEADSDTRAELRKMRQELEQLREEIRSLRKEKGRGSDSFGAL